jgi:tetratricopeptide (TPR) repeat protein
LGVVALALAASFVIVREARAQTDEAVEKAKEHFERGYDFFAQKRYQDAAAEFRTAYTFKPFAEFLFNEAVAYEKQNKKQEAITRYEQYIKEAAAAKDKKKAQDRIDALRAKEGTTPAPPPPPPDGVLIIDSVPSGANVYIDDKKDMAGTTPWNGSLIGQHKIIVESKGYRTFADSVTVRAGSLNTVKYALTPDPQLAWVVLRANVPGASVFLDDRAGGEIGRTTYLGNIAKGKHKFWISKDGYVEVFDEVTLEGGQNYEKTYTLQKGTIGFFYVTGRNVEGARVEVDGKMVCEKAPCRFQAPQGKRKIDITRDGFKPYTRDQDVMPATETTLNVALVEKPSRLDVLWNFGFAAAFLAGGVVLGLQSNSTYNSINDDIAAGKPPVFPDDSRFLKGKIFAIASDACFAIGAITAITGVVSLLLDKGPDSSALGETRDMGASITPMIGPGFAGVSAGVRW